MKQGIETAQTRALIRLLVSEVPRRISGRRPALDGHPTAERSGLVFGRDRCRRFADIVNVSGSARVDCEYLPPAATSAWETALVLDLLRAADFPFPASGLIHLADQRTCLRRTHTEEAHTVIVRLASSRAVRKGTILTIEAEVRNRLGQLSVASTGEFLFVGLNPGGAAGRSETSTTELTAPRTHRWKMDRGLGRSFAAVSGDFNPIHLSAATARLFGFRQAIAHGFCLEAMICNSLIASEFGGDAAALRRVELRFRQPVYLPSEVELRVGAGGDESAFELWTAGRAGRPCVVGSFSGSIGQG